ncbi:MAG: hypothetical protein PHE36_01765 [Novosphingobium sp.]|nr:hypothetical protein [Novosphingobium sp.]
MDLNELFYRQQVALIHADVTGTTADRGRFKNRAEGFGAQIGKMRHRLKHGDLTSRKSQ